MASSSATPEDHPLLIKPASLQTPSKALIPGTLSIARARGSWTPRDATAASPIHFPYASLTGALQRAKGKPMLRVPLATGPRVVVFESVEDTDQVVDLLTPLIAREQQGGGSSSGAASTATGTAAAPAKADAWSQAKRKLLDEDKDLKAVYDQLVGGGALMESEFWRGRADRLSAAKAEMTTAAAAAAAATGQQQKQHQATKTAAAAPMSTTTTTKIAPGQRVGLASALLVEEASANRQGGASNRATFRLTPELVLQIFAERPYVRAAYASAVPRSCGEAEFWKRYLRYEAVRKARRRLRAAGRDPSEAGPEDELFRQFRAERRAEAFGGGGGGASTSSTSSTAAAAAAAANKNEQQQQQDHVDPGVNLEADAADAAPPGYGLAHAGARDPAVGGGSAARPRAQATAASVAAERDAIVHELNRHAAVVLAGVPASLPTDAAAAAKALKEGGGPVAGKEAAAAAGASGAAPPPPPPPPLSAAAAAAAVGSAATAAAAAAAQEREEHELWRERAAAGLDDLRGAPREEFETLTVADPRGYFCGGEDGETPATQRQQQQQQQQQQPSSSWSPEAVVSALRAPTKKGDFSSSSSLSPHLDVFALFQSRDAVSALRNLAAAASDAGGDEAVSADDLLLAAATAGGGGEGRSDGASSFYSAAAALAADPAAALPPPLLALLRQAALTANELLRHFWSSAAASVTTTTTTTKNDASKAAAAAARVARVVKALGAQYDRIQAMQSAASSGSERAAVRRLLAPVAAAIDAALARAAALEEEEEQKRVRGGGGGGAAPMVIA